MEKTEVQHAAGWIRQTIRWFLAVVAAALVVAGLQLLPDREESGETAAGSGPATLEQVEGSDLTRVRLTESAAERLDVQTALVTAASGAPNATQVPYSAVIYDAEGNAWVYTEAEPLVYVRAPIEVERIDGTTAFLSNGPPVGTAVVQVGAAELYGAEFEVDH